MANDVLIEGLLAQAVPIRIKELHEKGGPNERDWKAASLVSDLIEAQGDNLLVRSQKKGQAAQLFSAITCALAVCAFAPGGITFAGKHYEAT